MIFSLRICLKKEKMIYMDDIKLTEEAEELADNIFKLAVITSDNPKDKRLRKLCKVLEHALERKLRREYKAGLVFQ